MIIMSFFQCGMRQIRRICLSPDILSTDMYQMTDTLIDDNQDLPSNA